MKYYLLSITALFTILLIFGVSCKKEKKDITCDISKLSGKHHWTSNDGFGSRSDDFPINVINDSTISVTGSPGGRPINATLKLISVTNGKSVFLTHEYFVNGNTSMPQDIDDEITLTYYCSQNKIVYVVAEHYWGNVDTYELNTSTN